MQRIVQFQIGWNAQLMIDRRDDIRRSNRILRGFPTDLVARSVDETSLRSAAGHQHGIAEVPVIAATVGIVDFWTPPKFSHDHHHRPLQHVPLDEILQQARQCQIQLRQQAILQGIKVRSVSVPGRIRIGRP